MKTKVLLDPAFREMDVIFTSEDLARIHIVAEILWASNELIPEEEIEKIQGDVEIIICGYWRYGDVKRFPRLRAILEVGGFFPKPDALDYGVCFSRGIRVLSCAPAFGPAVAEMALGLALACSRQISWTDRAFRQSLPQWSHSTFETELGVPFTLFGKRVGMIGFGGLAHALLPLLAPFNCPIQVYDPWLTDTYLEEQGVTPVDLDTLMSTSRVIFVLAVPSATNEAMLDREKLSLIAPDAVFLLISRSHLVDFDALTDLLLEGRFMAGIDVFPEEPLPQEHPIHNTNHAVLSSHRAGANVEALHNIGHLVANDLEALCSGKAPFAMQQAQPEYIRLRG
ncbi:MAG: NAD(P)-dependent oxidoreductase [Anaerolineae bacterium]|jgi:phosphoglycerate dehydrogenase-like enzyme|nr:NAD(P)-dependent oxidoreductase [Anaerolineae bacterium]